MNTKHLPGFQSRMRLYGHDSRRLYINASERGRFLVAAASQPDHIRVFCLTLLYTGCRLTEARELTWVSLQPEEQLLSIRCLKKRANQHVREVPIPASLVEEISRLSQGSLREAYLWTNPGGVSVNRVTAYRWVKNVMQEAGIIGPQACPKGLRHGYGIHAIRSGIPLNMLQKWMGHASIKTTAIYTNALGPEEREIAQRMWE